MLALTTILPKTLPRNRTAYIRVISIILVNVLASSFKHPHLQMLLLLLLLFLTFSVLVANPKKLLYTVANPARGLLNREKRTKEKVWQHTPPPTPHTAQQALRRWSVSRPYKDTFGSSTRPMGVASQFYTPVCDNKVPSLVASLFSWRCLAASTSSFLHAAINLRPPSVTVSTHTSAFKAVAFQSPAMPNVRMSLCTQSVHSFSFPPRPLRTAPSRFPKAIRFGSRPPLIRRSVPAHKSLLVRNVVSMLSHLQMCAPFSLSGYGIALCYI